MARARARVPDAARSLLRSDWEKVIGEAALGKEDTQIAMMYLLDAIPQIDIGVELNLDRTTVSRRLTKILPRIERTARKLNIM